MLITVDANIRISALLSDDEHHSKAIRLLSLAERGIVELQATTRLDNDISRDPWKSKLKAIPTLSTYRVGAPWRVGSTAIGNGDAIVSEQERHMLERQTKRSTNSNKLRLHSRVFEKRRSPRSMTATIMVKKIGPRI